VCLGALCGHSGLEAGETLMREALWGLVAIGLILWWASCETYRPKSRLRLNDDYCQAIGGGAGC
jgi:hypothetical protein